MLKNLFSPIAEMFIKLYLQLLKMQVKKMESARYLNLQARIELAKIKQQCIELNNKAQQSHAFS